MSWVKVWVVGVQSRVVRTKVVVDFSGLGDVTNPLLIVVAAALGVVAKVAVIFVVVVTVAVAAAVVTFGTRAFAAELVGQTEIFGGFRPFGKSVVSVTKTSWRFMTSHGRHRFESSEDRNSERIWRCAPALPVCGRHVGVTPPQFRTSTRHPQPPLSAPREQRADARLSLVGW